MQGAVAHPLPDYIGNIHVIDLYEKVKLAQENQRETLFFLVNILKRHLRVMINLYHLLFSE